MSTQYPAALDDFQNPLPGDSTTNPSHAVQHTNANDAIEAIQAYLGVATSIDPATITGRVAALEAGGGGGGGSTAWGDITGKPTTIAGYGITDAYTKTETSNLYLAKAGGTMSGAISYSNAFGTAEISVKTDPLSSIGSAMVINSPEGVIAQGPYIVLDTTNLQITMPGGLVGSPVVITGVDSFGVYSLGYGSPITYSAIWQDTNTTDVVIKAANTAPPTAWVSLGLIITPDQDVAAGTATLAFDMVLRNLTSRTGTVEYGLKVAGANPLTRDIFLAIPANFLQTVAFSIPLTNAYTAGQSLELVARVTANNNNQFSLDMVANAGEPATLRLTVVGSSSSSGVTTVTASLPLLSSGGINPNLSMPQASNTIDGYLGAADWITFNGKQAPATTLAGYGITDAYTKAQSDANYPTKAGTGASGVWGISITGNANTASVASIASYANSVEDLNNPANDVKQWIGTQAQYTALGSYDAATFYNITDAETPGGGGSGTSVSWDDVTDKPATFPPSAHNQDISTINGLQPALDGKLATTGNAASATLALAVDDTNSANSIKFWYGTEAQYTAIGSKDPNTLYFRSA